MDNATVIAVVGGIQAVSTGWLHYMVTHRDCGSQKCLAAIQKGIELERTSGSAGGAPGVAVSQKPTSVGTNSGGG